MLLPWALVAIGGALGAVCRYGVDRAMASAFGATAWSTFAVNISGSFLLGLLIAIADERIHISPEARAIAAIGFLGSYTTFSTLTVASVRLAGEGHWLYAAANIIGSLAVGILAALAGILIGRSI